jgi:LacI family gluconate utilization system Gnt-I transcriptional repressor
MDRRRHGLDILTGRPGTITISDVAREARVGESTVSRVLRNQGSVSEKTRARVLCTVDRLGYVPNRLAGTLASTGSRLVAIVIPSVTNAVFADVLSGVEATLSESGRQAVFGVAGYDQAHEETLIESMLAWRPAGLIVAGLEHSGRAVAMMRGSGIRIAEILDTDGAGLDLVIGFSNMEVGRASARFLLERGRRRIGYAGHDLTRDLRAGKRLAGFKQGLAEAGLALAAEEIVYAPSSIEAGRNALEALLARHPDLDAVYFSNDDMAIGGYFYCLAQGIAIPEQLALMGYNGLDIGRFAPHPLATVRTPRRFIGEIAARLVCSDAPGGVHDAGFELIPGATA